MTLFMLNLMLALGWAVVTGGYSLGNLIFGFVIGYFALWVSRPLYGSSAYFGRLVAGIRLATFFLYDLVMSSIQVVWDVVTPSHKSRPGIIAVKLDAKTDLEIMLTANLISLTPGTLSLELSDDKSILYVHAMFIDDPDDIRRQVKEGMERRVLEVLR
ncbi:Na+/H+ antiporter subunit E [Telmatospirillum sp. J64-1]|uniref:Na+/H+ antiporter subunit E n=1 Tax=Telmatospirillum sp. J64-1 TaxID=2502183 RepID=UPI00115C87CE|nr:Na+/H+ antiporter subunit E [Telmatospirillum sp. J64-1]